MGRRAWRSPTWYLAASSRGVRSQIGRCGHWPVNVGVASMRWVRMGVHGRRWMVVMVQEGHAVRLWSVMMRHRNRSWCRRHSHTRIRKHCLCPAQQRIKAALLLNELHVMLENLSQPLRWRYGAWRAGVRVGRVCKSMARMGVSGCGMVVMVMMVMMRH